MDLYVSFYYKILLLHWFQYHLLFIFTNFITLFTFYFMLTHVNYICLHYFTLCINIKSALECTFWPEGLHGLSTAG